VAGGVDGSALGGRPGQGSFSASGEQYLEINGGDIAVAGDGDGLDINRAITMSAGVLLVNGPTSDGNGALDYDRGFKMTGGYLLAVGSAGMAQAPDQSSTQNALMVNLDAAQPAGALVHIAAKGGEEILTFAPTKPYRSVVFCSPELVSGATYLFYTGGAATGQARDGLYSGGAYTGGTWVASVTLTGVVTRVGSSGGMMRGGGGRGGR